MLIKQTLLDLFQCCPCWLYGCLLVFVAFLLYTIYINWSLRKMPPGPRAYPIVGTIYSTKGGPLYIHAAKFRVGNSPHPPPMVTHVATGRPFVLVNDCKRIKILYQDMAQFTSDRRPFPVQFLTNPKQLGLIQSPGKQWVPLRRLSLHILRELGFGKSIVERSIKEQCEHLNRHLTQHANNEALEMSSILSGCTSDIISMLLFNKKPFMDQCASDMQYVTYIQEFMRSSFRILTFLPALYHLYKLPVLKDYLPYSQRFKLDVEVCQYLRRQIVEHRQSFTPLVDTPRDFVDHFLLLQHTAKDKYDPEVLTDENLAFLLRDLFIAGTDTTSVTLCWALALLCHREDVQEKVHQELMSVFGDSVQPDMARLNECPYTRAVMSEVFRYGVTAPGSLVHGVDKDLQVDEYTIPQDTILIFNIFAVCRDSRIWKKPEEFYPEHFYDTTTETYVPNENLLNFSTGRRICLGENLAKQEFFVFLASMLLKFRFTFAKKQEFTEEEILGGCSVGVVRSPNLFYVNAIPRE